MLENIPVTIDLVLQDYENEKEIDKKNRNNWNHQSLKFILKIFVYL